MTDRATREENIKTKVPPSWEIPSEGPKALLRAAMEADETILKEVVMRARKSDLCDVDVNMTDSSGRVSSLNYFLFVLKKKKYICVYIFFVIYI